MHEPTASGRSTHAANEVPSWPQFSPVMVPVSNGSVTRSRLSHRLAVSTDDTRLVRTLHTVGSTSAATIAMTVVFFFSSGCWGPPPGPGTAYCGTVGCWYGLGC